MPGPSQLASFCSDRARAAQEPLFGTATRIRTWVLLEYPGGWAPDPFPSSTLPAPVKAHLSTQLGALRASRLLFIKQRARLTDERVIYVACADELEPRLYRVLLRSYNDLLDLDLVAFAAGDAECEQYRIYEPLWLACTHGVHDKCCARRGLPVYAALMALPDETAWQCSHVGGDRFAANVLCFPHAIYYGQMDQADLATIAAEYRQGRVHLPNYRGRSCYSFLVQAAEYLLRQRSGLLELPGVRLEQSERLDERRWRVTFELLATGRRRGVEIEVDESERATFLTCSATVPGTAPRYRLVSIDEA